MPFFLRVLDFVLHPIMWILSGCKKDSVQETHPWHIQTFPCEDIPDNAGIEVAGEDRSPFTHFSYGLNHMPLFGGWEKQVVFETQEYRDYWYIGWKVFFKDKHKKPLCQIQKLKIYAPSIKVLVGINDSKKIFFGLNKNGEVMQLKRIGNGVLGDKKYQNTRLF